MLKSNRNKTICFSLTGFRRKVFRRVSFYGAAFGGAILLASANVLADYTATVIATKEEVQEIVHGDFNGNQLGDIALITWSEAFGRELLIYFQNPNGQYPSAPSRRIEIKADIIALAIGDVREQAGEEILFLTRSAIYSFSSANENYSNNLKKLFNIDFINTVPHRKDTLFFGHLQDYNGDNKVDILIPGTEQYSLYYGQGSDIFSQAKSLPIAFDNPSKTNQGAGSLNFSIDGDNGLSFSRSAPPSAFTELLEDQESLYSDASRSVENEARLLERRNWIPVVLPVKINQDDISDFVFIDDAKENDSTLQQLNILLPVPASPQESQQKSTLTINKHWKVELDTKDALHFVDFTGDQLDDIYTIANTDNGEITYYFYTNEDGVFDFSRPDQIIKFSGYSATLSFVDINNDAIPELIISYYQISNLEALRSGSLLRNFVVYSGKKSSDGDSSVFAKRPSLKQQQKFSSNAFKGLAQAPIIDVDVNGDQSKDLVSIDNDGKLTAHAISTKLEISDKHFWQFVPSHIIQEVITASLNTDKTSDFILLHQNSITLLVSKP